MDMFYGELGLSDVPDEVSSNSHLPRFCGHLRGYAHEIVQRMLQGSLFWGRSLVSYVKVPGPIHGHDATPFNRKTETNGTKSNPHHYLSLPGPAWKAPWALVQECERDRSLARGTFSQSDGRLSVPILHVHLIFAAMMKACE